jgi:hypothetical protein
MFLPLPLQQAINIALTAVHDELMLPYKYRQTIYDLYKSVDNVHAYQRRTQLDMITARYVLPIWQYLYPNDLLPYNLLGKAEGVLRGEPFDLALFEDVIETLHFGFLAEWKGINRTDKERALSACFAAACALRTASQNDPSTEQIIREHFTTEAGNFDEDYDVTTWAVRAVATVPGGMDTAKCLTFWEWWLNEAVSEAWNIVP